MCGAGAVVVSEVVTEAVAVAELVIVAMTEAVAVLSLAPVFVGAVSSPPCAGRRP